MQISTLVPEIFKLENCVKYANERADDVMHTLNQILHQVNKLTYLGQFEAETIETWPAISSTYNTPTTIKNVSFHGNPLFSSRLQPYFNILVIFSSKNCKQGHELDLTY